MISNVNPSKLFVNKGAIAPQSLAAGATVMSGWIDAAQLDWLKLGLLVGAGAGTVAVKVEQATSAAGAGSKDLYAAAQVGITAQGTGQAQADVALGANLDIDNAYRFVRVSVTCTGGAGTFASVTVEGGPPRFGT